MFMKKPESYTFWPVEAQNPDYDRFSTIKKLFLRSVKDPLYSQFCTIIVIKFSH